MEEVRVIASPQGFAVYGPKREKLAVAAVDIFVRSNGPPQCAIMLAGGNVDVQGGAFYALVDPKTGKPRMVKAIVWADGEVSEFALPPGALTIVTPEAGGTAAA